MIIYLQPDTPNEYIPKIGTKLVSIETDTTFSGGFMGCVKYTYNPQIIFHWYSFAVIWDMSVCF